MENYKIHKVIGDGSYGTVYKATNIKTGEIVAIKKMKKKFASWDECMSLRELKSLKKLSHPNIVKLKQAIKAKDELHFVFEFLDLNVFQMYNNTRESGKVFTENQIRSIVYQTALGLANMHKHGFFHRDLKPENLLMHKDCVKIADLGLAREIRSRPPYTDYVATRWYRAPEILLKSTNYNSPVDIFALGCIMAELYTFSPLFRGTSEPDQIYKVCSILGTPTQATWSEGMRLASQMAFTFPQFSAVPLETIIPNASDEAIQLISEMIKYDAHKRPSAQQVLQHPYFMNFVHIERPITPQMAEGSPNFISKAQSTSRDTSPAKQARAVEPVRNIDISNYLADARSGIGLEGNNSPVMYDKFQTNDRNQRDSPYLGNKKYEPKNLDRKFGSLTKNTLNHSEIFDELTNSKDKQEADDISAKQLEDEINRALETMKTETQTKPDFNVKRTQAKASSIVFNGASNLTLNPALNDSGLTLQTKNFHPTVNSGGIKAQPMQSGSFDPWDDMNNGKNSAQLRPSPYDFLSLGGTNSTVKPTKTSPLTLPGSETTNYTIPGNNVTSNNNLYGFSTGSTYQGPGIAMNNVSKPLQNNANKNAYSNSSGLKMPGSSAFTNTGNRISDGNLHLGSNFDFEAALQEEVGGLNRYKY